MPLTLLLYILPIQYLIYGVFWQLIIPNDKDILNWQKNIVLPIWIWDPYRWVNVFFVAYSLNYI